MKSGHSYKEYKRIEKLESAQHSAELAPTSKRAKAEVTRQEAKLAKLEAKIAHHEQRIANADATITRLQTTKASANWSPSELKEWMQAKQDRREARVDLSHAQNGNTLGNVFSRLNNWMKHRSDL